MPDLRSPTHDLIDEHRERSLYDTNASDWLTLPQAACELGMSVSTARRMIRQGRLRNRIVPRRGGFAYLVYVPDSRHATLLADCPHEHVAPATEPHEPAFAIRIRTLEEQVDNLSAALSRALRRAPGAAVGRSVDPSATTSAKIASPYAHYRGAVQSRRWWPF